MRLSHFTIAVLAWSPLVAAQTASDENFKLALPDHNGRLAWSAPSFKIIQNSAKPAGNEIGIRGRDETGRLTFLGFLFLFPEQAPMTSAKCRDGVLGPEKKANPSLKVLSSTEATRADGVSLALVAYSVPERGGGLAYRVRGFLAVGDVCGDLEFYSTKPLSADDADMRQIFSTYRLDPAFVPQFADIVTYAQVLYQAKMFKAAGSLFEKALPLVPTDGKPFPSAIIARRIVMDQAGLSYGMAGEILKARSIFERGVREDPEYPLYYYNLACADAEEKKLADARRHLDQAFAHKANVNPGETMPDPTKDESFVPYRANQDFWSFLERLEAGK